MWDFRTDTYYELLSKSQAVAQGWAKATDKIKGVRIYATPVEDYPAKSSYIQFGSGIVWGEPSSRLDVLRSVKTLGVNHGIR